MKNAAALYAVYNAALEQAFEKQDRFLICDVSNQPVPHGDALSFFREQITGGMHTNSLSFGAA